MCKIKEPIPPKVTSHFLFQPLSQYLLGMVKIWWGWSGVRWGGVRLPVLRIEILAIFICPNC
jgi:hypothetical protein